MAVNIDYEAPTWNQIYRMLINQAKRIKKSFNPDIIVGICRGGWIPARILSDLLDNPNLANVGAGAYLGIEKAKDYPTITQEISMSIKGKKVLLVDEIADSGKSLQLIISHLNQKGASEFRTATLYYKSRSLIKPDYYEKETSNWIIFPWDTREVIKEIQKNHKDKPNQFKKQTEKLITAGIPKWALNLFLKDSSGETKC